MKALRDFHTIIQVLQKGSSHASCILSLKTPRDSQFNFLPT
ncbi:hypothetical protein HHX47_DHR10000442, partial [Lentinula edodes]